MRPRFVSGFGPLSLEPGAKMTPVTLPAATSGNGSPYTYGPTSSPADLAGLSFNETTRVLSGRAFGPGDGIMAKLGLPLPLEAVVPRIENLWRVTGRPPPPRWRRARTRSTPNF